jgi:hypothetical protein
MNTSLDLGCPEAQEICAWTKARLTDPLTGHYCGAEDVMQFQLRKERHHRQRCSRCREYAEEQKTILAPPSPGEEARFRTLAYR